MQSHHGTGSLDASQHIRREALTSDRKIHPGARALGLVYAATAATGTVAFFATFIFFLGNLPKISSPWLVPSADKGPAVTPLLALVLNAMLLALFSLQHSLMARPFFKRLVCRVIPQPLERATYVHAANLAGFLLIALWQPVPIVIWNIRNELLEPFVWTAFGLGWLLLFAAAFSMNILELLGLRQAWRWYRGRTPLPLTLSTSWLYRYLEHPMYVGVILGFWMTPYMTLGHAALATQLTLYIAVAVGYERRDLRQRFGSDYECWCKGAPHRSLPAGAPAWAPIIAPELSRLYKPVTLQPLPPRMRLLLDRL